VGMGVCVDIVRRTMRRPARMAYADRPGNRVLGHHPIERAHLACLFPDLKPTVDNGDAGRVVSTVLEPLQSVQKDRRCVAIPDIAYDSTHGIVRNSIRMTFCSESDLKDSSREDAADVADRKLPGVPI